MTFSDDGKCWRKLHWFFSLCKYIFFRQKLHKWLPQICSCLLELKAKDQGFLRTFVVNIYHRYKLLLNYIYHYKTFGQKKCRENCLEWNFDFPLLNIFCTYDAPRVLCDARERENVFDRLWRRETWKVLKLICDPLL